MKLKISFGPEWKVFLEIIKEVKVVQVKLSRGCWSITKY